MEWTVQKSVSSFIICQKLELFPPDPPPVSDLQSAAGAGGGLLTHHIGRPRHRGLAPEHGPLQQAVPPHLLVDEHVVREGVQDDLHVVLDEVIFTKGQFYIRKRIDSCDLGKASF